MLLWDQFIVLKIEQKMFDFFKVQFKINLKLPKKNISYFGKLAHKSDRQCTCKK